MYTFGTPTLRILLGAGHNHGPRRPIPANKFENTFQTMAWQKIAKIAKLLIIKIDKLSNLTKLAFSKGLNLQKLVDTP